ncbi:peptidoglycan-binding protein [Stenotrophomonas sp.]|uniref:peptidoglycan-binding protein n=1 Tax=Stenotrophomonas sp. TaxID=69392 RepID=UPI002FC82DFF
MASTNDRGEILDVIERQAERSGIPREDFLRFAYIETGGNFNATAHNTGSGAKGLFQFVPSTAAEFGLTGREFDPAANTEAAASLYARNRTQITDRQAQTGHAFLSGADQPNGLDMYLAHQQGGGGYASIQRAIATGEFSRDDTRNNILGNVSSRDFERVTGQPFASIRDMNDRDLATSFTQYWNTKYAAIEIADRGITASAPAPAARAAAVAAPLADGVLQRGERGEDVRALQESLNQMGFRDAQGNALETTSGIYGQHTQEAVRSFQAANALAPSGNADAATREALAAQQAQPASGRNRPAEPETRREAGIAWPAPGNDRINEADKPREGRGEFGTARSGGRTHGGIDIQGEVGDPIAAFAGGTVTVTPNNRAAGNTVRITHDDGSVTKYFHLDKIQVSNGDRVEAGQQIATMGRTGNTPAQGDTHLHFELWRDGRKVDPLPELRGSDRGASAEAPARAAAGERPATLRVGAHGAGVSALQDQLNTLGYKDAAGKALASDGHFGPATRDALLGLQRAEGIKADGIAGPETWGKLSELARGADKAGDSRSGAAEGHAPTTGSSSFVERMFAAVRNPESGSVQKVIDDFASTMKSPQWESPAPPMEQVNPDPGKGTPDPQR